MAAVCNGLYAYGGFIPFCATFLTFIGCASSTAVRAQNAGRAQSLTDPPRPRSGGWLHPQLRAGRVPPERAVAHGRHLHHDARLDRPRCVRGLERQQTVAALGTDVSRARYCPTVRDVQARTARPTSRWRPCRRCARRRTSWCCARPTATRPRARTPWPSRAAAAPACCR